MLNGKVVAIIYVTILTALMVVPEPEKLAVRIVVAAGLAAVIVSVLRAHYDEVAKVVVRRDDSHDNEKR